MAVHNADIAELFNHLADLLLIEGANPFRVRTYRRAAQTIEDLPKSAAEMVAAGEDLSELPGIGKDLAGKIEEIVETGRLRMLEEVEGRMPSTLTELTALPGLGPKRVHALFEKLGIKTLDQLASAAKAHKICGLAGVSEKSEAKILDEIAKHRVEERRYKISTAEDFAETLRAYMQRCSAVGRAVVAGSYRRCKDTVGDLDLLVTSKSGRAAIDHFVNYDEIAEVVAKGPTRSTVVLEAGIQVDLRVVPTSNQSSERTEAKSRLRSQGRPTAAKISSSLRPAILFVPRKAPYSLILRPFVWPSLRTAML